MANGAVNALRELNFHVATGDSTYNDTSDARRRERRHSLPSAAERDRRVPQFPVATNYEELKAAFVELSDGSMQP